METLQTKFHLMFKDGKYGYEECVASADQLDELAEKIALDNSMSASLKSKIIDGITDNMDKILNAAKEGVTGQVVVSGDQNDQIRVSITQ